MTQTKTFSLNNGKANVVVRESVGLDQLDAVALYPLLTYNRKSPRERKRASSFVDAFLRSEVGGELLFAWPADDSDSAALQAAFEGWQTLPQVDLVTWINELDAVNKKLLDPNSPPPQDGGNSSGA